MFPGIKIVDKILPFFQLLLVSVFFCGCGNGGRRAFVQRHRVRDSLAICDIQFYARLSHNLEVKTLAVEIETITPKGLSYIDTLFFPVDMERQGVQVQISGMWKDVVSNYRKSVNLPEKGVWLFRLTPLFEDENRIRSVKEMGVMVLPTNNENKENGKR